jgi:replicative DNA helicase
MNHGSMLDVRTPPHSRASEELCLRALCWDKSLVKTSGLLISHFYTERHRRAFTALWYGGAGFKIPDEVALELRGTCPPEEEFRAACVVLKKTSLLRDVIQVTARSAEEAYAMSDLSLDDIQRFITDLAQDLKKLVEAP